MKLEVGKKYLDKEGLVVTVLEEKIVISKTYIVEIDCNTPDNIACETCYEKAPERCKECKYTTKLNSDGSRCGEKRDGSIILKEIK